MLLKLLAEKAEHQGAGLLRRREPMHCQFESGRGMPADFKGMKVRTMENSS